MSEQLLTELQERVDQLTRTCDALRDDYYRLSDDYDSLSSRLAELEDRGYGLRDTAARVEAALMDVQGVNLEQRIALAAARLVEQMGVTVPPQGTAGATPASATVVIDQYVPPNQLVYFSRSDDTAWATTPSFDLDIPADDAAFDQDGVDYDVPDLPADSGTGYVADDVALDDGADRSEAGSPDGSDL